VRPGLAALCMPGRVCLGPACPNWAIWRAQVEALRPGLLGGSREAFAARYCARRLVPVSGGEPGRLRWFNGGLAHAAELHALLKQARAAAPSILGLGLGSPGPAAWKLRDMSQVGLSCWRLTVGFAMHKVRGAARHVSCMQCHSQEPCIRAALRPALMYGAQCCERDARDDMREQEDDPVVCNPDPFTVTCPPRARRRSCCGGSRRRCLRSCRRSGGRSCGCPRRRRATGRLQGATGRKREKRRGRPGTTRAARRARRARPPVGGCASQTPRGV